VTKVSRSRVRKPGLRWRRRELVRAFEPGEAAPTWTSCPPTQAAHRPTTHVCVTGVGDDTATLSVVEPDFTDDDSTVWQRTAPLVDSRISPE
jgi:hypothetical protein